VVGSGPSGVGAAVPRDQAAAALAALAAGGGAGNVTLDEEVGKVTVVGAALGSQPAAGEEAAAALRRAGIEVLLTAAAPLRVSWVVPVARLDEAVRLLHRTLLTSGSEEGR